MKKYGFEYNSNSYENVIIKQRQFAKQAKIKRLQEPAIQIEEIYLEATQVVSFVVDTIRAIARKLSALQDALGITDTIESEQVTGLLGTTRVLTKLL